MQRPTTISDESPSSVNVPDIVVTLFRSVLGWIFAILIGVVGVFVTRFMGFSSMVAAQITIGVFGVGGGLSHALLIRSAGANVSWRHVLLLTVIWALSFIGGVTPLFFVMGTGLKMGMLTFYSFAVFGALGGVATAFVMRPLFSDAYAREVMPCALIWSFSLGLAGIASDTLGEGLQMFLPGVIAWIISSGVLALIIGCGGGFSIVRFLQTAAHHKENASVKSRIDHQLLYTKGGNGLYVLTLILLCLPFYLNDFSNIYVTDWRLWIFIDYTSVKLFPFLVVFWLISTRRMRPSEFGLISQPVIPFLTVFLIGTLAVTFIVQNGYLILNWFPGYPHLGEMPEIKSPLWRWIDLTIGLLMVGIFEELVFRGYLYTFITRYTRRPWIIIGISAIVFGFIHWSEGLDSVILTAAAGAVFMLLYLQTLSLPAIMLAHFMVDFIEFANIIPKSIFRLF
ncbi:MAG: CPBP family intramembrane metalloprotease [Desulfobacteraceae bacterium]|nr:CPBP family intramembrane metalloprotease [Desulfobacteraceae bacterium]